MALSYLMREKTEENICDSPYKKCLRTAIYFRRVFTFVLCTTLDYKERKTSKYSSTDGVFVAETSPVEMLVTYDQVKNVYSYSSCHWCFSSITRRIQK